MENIKFRAWERNEDPSFDHMVVEKITLSRVIWDHIRNQRTQQSWRYPYFSDSKQTYEIMQYTGLKDKNWVEVYEGDIVKWEQTNWWIIVPDNNAYICLIERDRIWRSCKKNKEHVWFTLASEHIEVIGNIYETPELLN